MQLSSLLIDELNLKDYQKKALKKLGLKTIKDILWHFPNRYKEPVKYTTISEVKDGEEATLYGKISNLEFQKTWRKKLNITRATLYDRTGIINLVWFHQPYIAKILNNDDTALITGKIQKKKDKNTFYISNPIYEKTPPLTSDVDKNNGITKNQCASVYPETRGLSSRWFSFTIRKILKKIITDNPEELEDVIPKKIREHYHLPSLKNSLIYIHTPQKNKNAEVARKRFAFEEIFLVQISRIKKRLAHKKLSSFSIKINKKDLDKFTKSFPFELTKSQQKSIKSIIKDLEKDNPMSRFLEGDVGSGKTAVASVISYLILKNGYQTAYMAPTEVLAKQIFESFTEYFKNSGARIGLITSSMAKKFPSKVGYEKYAEVSKAKLQKWIREGEIDIIIGTHSLIQDKIKFSIKEKDIYKDKKLALVIIDEQHRFGTNQRAALINKKNETDKNLFPHLLSMSATPIPRTLALTIYGDLDLTLLDEMPPGRKKIITEIVPPNERQTAYEKIREEIKKGRQAYVICPRINPADPTKESIVSLNMRAVKEEHKKLSEEIFPKYKIDMLYGKMTSKEKDKTMQNFEAGKTKILIATSVIEVGVNIPNATTIIIEGAERFGLAQLHQLRGRVLRSMHQPYCFIFTESKTQKTLDRLKALKTAKNGFELAEYDLEFRGAGMLSGKKQWGISDVGMEALKNIKMVEAARTEAENILSEDDKLKKYPLIKKRIKQDNLDIHME